MNRVYVFSGLGADERVFDQIDFTPYSPVFITWITPLKQEPLDYYAKRIAMQITCEQPILIGISFGGIIAQEVARYLQSRCVIILASVKTYYEIPFYFRWAGALHLHQLIPSYFFLRSNKITEWFFGVTTNEQKKLLRQILQNTDPVFMRWALHSIVTWRKRETSITTIHIHGSADRIFPFRFVDADYTISNGGHFLTLTHAEVVSTYIRKSLDKYYNV